MVRTPELSLHNKAYLRPENPQGYAITVANDIRHREHAVREKLHIPDEMLRSDPEYAEALANQAATLIRRKLRHYPVVIGNIPEGTVFGMFPDTDPGSGGKLLVTLFDRFTHEGGRRNVHNAVLTLQFHPHRSDNSTELILQLDDDRKYNAPGNRQRRRILVTDTESKYGPKGFFVVSDGELLLARVDSRGSVGCAEFYKGENGWIISGVGLSKAVQGL